MSWIQLLSAIGEDNINVQFIDDCTSNFQMTKRQGNKLTVHTNESFDQRGMHRFGIVLWVDRQALILAQLKEGGA